MTTAIYDRVRETSTTTGTGSLTLAGAATGFRTFSSVLATNDTTYYCIQNQGVPSEWEVGYGTLTASTTLARTTVIASSNSGSAVSLSAGTKDVFITAAARLTPIGFEVLQANRTYYVRTDGSDSNTGLVNSSGGAFLTIQKAVDTIVSTLDTAGYTVTISVGSGTFTTAVVLGRIRGNGSVVISGAGLASTTISTTSADCVKASQAGSGWSVTNLKMQTTTSGNCLLSEYQSVLVTRDVAFGTCAGFHVAARMCGIIQLDGSYTINGNAQYHIRSVNQGTVEYSTAGTVTLTGTPAFTVFAAADRFSLLFVFASPTYSGAATGSRYSATLNGVIFSNSGGANFFPGNSAGSTATGGQYA